jgi:hypothetical protein
MEAAHCQKKMGDQRKFLELAQSAIDAYCLGRRMGSAASLAKECAEMLEEKYDYEEASNFYIKYSELSMLDELTS